jgi:chorismate mutase
MKRIFGIRGAVCAENTAESIQKNVGFLCAEIFSRNKIQSADVVSVHFTMTRDLDAMNAASALRKSDVKIDTSNFALFTSKEAEIRGMMPRVIRVLVTAYLDENAKIVHVYENGAEKLRPDFKSAEEK